MVVGPPFHEDTVRATGHPFLTGGKPNPKEEQWSSPLEQLVVFERAGQDWQPDVILREPFEYMSAEAAARLGVPAVQIAHGLSGRMWERLRGFAPRLDAFREGLVDELRRAPFLTRLPASLDASPFPATVRYREPAVAPSKPLPAWWADTGAPLVYVSFGSVVGGWRTSGEIYRTVIEAVAGLDARVLVTVGRDFDLSRLTDVPVNVHVEAWVSQADILGEAGLIICHGGSGTVYGALAAGVPLVDIPMFADQFANATIVAGVGAGIQVLTGQEDARGRRVPVREDAPRIRQAIEAVLADGSFRRAAQEISAEMTAAPPIEKVLREFLQGG